MTGGTTDDLLKSSTALQKITSKRQYFSIVSYSKPIRILVVYELVQLTNAHGEHVILQ
jgi:hypothetical protein